MTDGRIPLIFASTSPASDIERARTALVLTSGMAEPAGFALVRHVAAAAMARGGTCACCRVPSDLASLLRRLVIDRASGTVDFAAVLVIGDDRSFLREMTSDVRADPFVAARYAVSVALD